MVYKYYGGDCTTTMTIPLLLLRLYIIYILYDHYFIYIYISESFASMWVTNQYTHTHTIAHERRPLLYWCVPRAAAQHCYCSRLWNLIINYTVPPSRVLKFK